MDIVESLTRWLHVVAGIMWIGHLWFFNFVNANFAPTLDADSKKKVVPELMPRALFWFRWGAAFTWVTGVMLLGLVFYMNQMGLLLEADATGERKLGAIGGIAILLTFVAPFIYDALAKTVLKDPTKAFWGGWVLASAVFLFFRHVGGFSFRGATIHLGAMFGTIMAFNVWFRIWPNQRQIIKGIATGEAVDATVPALAGLRSKHNTYMSVPLVFTMLNAHATWAAFNATPGKFSNDYIIPGLVLVMWLFTYHLYEVAKKEAPKFY
jgi:uncharacterized membrane protein